MNFGMLGMNLVQILKLFQNKQPNPAPKKSGIVTGTGKGRFLKEAGVAWDNILGGLAVSPGAWIAVVGSVRDMALKKRPENENG